MKNLFTTIFCLICCLLCTSCTDMYSNVETQSYYYDGTYYPIRYHNNYPYYYFNYHWVPIPRERHIHIINYNRHHNGYHHYNRHHNRPYHNGYHHNNHHYNKPHNGHYNSHTHNYQNRPVRKPNNTQKRTINQRPHNTGRK